MLADDIALLQPAGRLSESLDLSAQWRDGLIGFIADALPVWRDDPDRPPATAETVLTSQLCGFLNSATRMSRGWDFLQFRVEEPDEVVGGRAIDMVAAPSGAHIWIEGRRYTQYQPLFPIECKRLPTPPAASRDEREYLHSRFGSRGGVQRFKAGHHGANHDRAALIAYIQADDIKQWRDRLGVWVEDLSASSTDWMREEALRLDRHDTSARLGLLSSRHFRSGGLSTLALDHLWIEM